MLPRLCPDTMELSRKGMTMSDFIALSTARQREIELQRRLERRRRYLERAGDPVPVTPNSGVWGRLLARLFHRDTSLHSVTGGC